MSFVNSKSFRPRRIGLCALMISCLALLLPAGAADSESTLLDGVGGAASGLMSWKQDVATEINTPSGNGDSPTGGAAVIPATTTVNTNYLLPFLPEPENRWSFNGPAGAAPAGTTFIGSGTGTIATVLGNGATTTGTTLVLPGTTTGIATAAAISAYLNLPNGFVSSRPSATYEIWLTPISNKFWQRIFDFGRGTTTLNSSNTGEIIDGAVAPGGTTSYDGLMLSLNYGWVLGSHRLEARLAGGSVTALNTDLSGSTVTGTEYHYAMVVEDGAGAGGSAGCQVRWYRNGTLQGSMDLAYRMSAVSDVNNWIGRSAWTAISNSNIAINELRVHRRALSQRELLASVAAGPDAKFVGPVAVADSATIHPNQKVRVDVLANDTNSPIPYTLQIVSAPTTGTATVSDGKILYAHSGSSATPVSFTYRVSNVSDMSPNTADGVVTINFATSLRLTNPALAMPAAPPATTWQMVDALPGLTFARPICLAPVPGDTKQLYVCEQGGVIRRVADVTSLMLSSNVFLDLTTLGTGFNIGPFLGAQPENGLLGLAFHPNYAINGYFYVAYTVNVSGTYYQRVSRFTRDATNPTIANPASELVLLHISDFGLNHNGGDLHFGPTDGYLYYGTGDGGNSTSGQAKSQKINDNFYSGMFRMDVDKKAGSLPPNPHASIPTVSGVAAFNVPPDNPFVHTSLGGTWNGTYNNFNYSDSLGSVRTEFWATGIRHCWRFSFDTATGDLWEGDVGQDTYEEINKIVKGGNYGWAYREGFHTFSGILGAAPAGFTSIDPIYEYPHTGGDALYQGNSVVGGYVYRGARYPSLVGSYIFSDSISGHVWQMNTTTGATTRLTGLPGAYGVISAQGVDPFNKDLLFCSYLAGKIMRLTTSDSSSTYFPPTLSATGLFADLTDLSPAPGLLPYEPNLKFWSDYADKRRWFTIPDATRKMTWSKDGNWTYPTGTVWVKHFDLAISRDNPATKKRIETRVLVKTDTGSYGVSYRWNDTQTEANLVSDAGEEFELAIDDHGTPHTQRWQIPGRTSCITCHTPQGGHALSFNTRQLNRDNTINGFSGNQLQLLSDQGFLTNTPDPVATLPRHVLPSETQFPLEQRARSYFAVNCSYCHQAGGTAGGSWDGRGHLTLEQTGLINNIAENPGGSLSNRYIVPGDTTHSIALNRMAATNGFGRMPPLGSNEIDPTNIQLITDWINTSLPGRPIYQQWSNGFFSTSDPKGDKTADPDGDGVSNYEEYLRGSSPVSGSGAWQASIANGSLQFLRKSNRFYSIQKSDTLGQWQPWTIPELESSYKTTDEVLAIPLPANPNGKQFFRFNISEP